MEYRGVTNKKNPHRHGWKDVKKRVGEFISFEQHMATRGSKKKGKRRGV